MYFVERQAPNGHWSRRIGFRPTYRYELAQLAIPDDRIDDVQQQLNELTPGYSLTLDF